MIRFISFVTLSKRSYTHRNQFGDQTSKNRRKRNRISVDPRFNHDTAGDVAKGNFHCKKTKCGKWEAEAGITLFVIALFAITVVAIDIYSLVSITADGLLRSSTTLAPCTVRVYSQYFVSGVSSTSQCAAWTSSLTPLTCISYSQLQLSASKDPTGITLIDSTIVNGIITALRISSSYNGTSNGYIWNVGIGLTTTDNSYDCFAAYTIRPYISVNVFWGGINSTACSTGSQTMTLSFQ